MNKYTPSELELLQVEHGQITREYNQLKAEYKQTNRRMAILKPRLVELGNKIQGKKEALKEPVVSDHAIRRYFERCKGFDIEQVKRDILTGHDHTAIVDRNVVVTVITRPDDPE